MTVDALVAERKLDALRHALGQIVLDALDEPRVVEVLANPDGRLVLDRLGEGRSDTGRRLSAEARERTILLVADHVGEPITREDPRLSGVLPGGERFQGFLPPVTSAPAFSIRKRPAVIWTLDDYVDQDVLTPDQARALRMAAVSRCNILISGGTGSGKTTLANALLAEPAFAGDRVFLVEDTPELQCSAWDLVPVLTRRLHWWVTHGLGDLQLRTAQQAYRCARLGCGLGWREESYPAGVPVQFYVGTETKLELRCGKCLAGHLLTPEAVIAGLEQAGTGDGNVGVLELARRIRGPCPICRYPGWVVELKRPRSAPEGSRSEAPRRRCSLTCIRLAVGSVQVAAMSRASRCAQ